MGIVKNELAVFELSDGRTCRIEENIGGEIHVHIGKVRMDLTQRELIEFAKTLQEGQKELHRKKEWN